MNPFQTAVLGVVETVFPERCCLCGVDAADAPFTQRGEPVAGLRWWDRPHLCRRCEGELFGEGPRVRPAREGLPPVWSAADTGPGLVRAVGNLKYHGVRGLDWPLARHMAEALPAELPACRFVAVPLHRRRRRTRGFNQAGLLARLVGRRLGLEVDDGALVRSRATGQQAKLDDDLERRVNLAGAFAWRGAQPCRPIVLVDDIVTSGATAQEAAGAVRRAGGYVMGVLACGAAVGDRGGRAG